MSAAMRATGLLLTIPALALAAVRVEAAPTSTPAPPPASGDVLDVPYVPQTEALCGGAAAAMVMRYWGAREIQPNDFEALVDRDRAGIDTRVLTSALAERGWRAYPFTGSPGSVRHHLDLGRPLIALLQVESGAFHYVVVLAWTDEGVVVHDPATLPSRTYRITEFDAAWSGSSRWTLLLLPHERRAAVAGARGMRGETDVRLPPARCRPLLDRGIALAREGALDEAQALLGDAMSTCPRSSAPWREAASVSLLQQRPVQAAARAVEALERDPTDGHAWRVLGTARYLSQDDQGALDAWNRLQAPTLDLIRVDGLTRTRYRVATEVTGLTPGAVLTAADLVRARRRLAAMPTIQAVRLDYVSAGGGLVDAEAAVVERPMMPTSRLALAALGVGAVVDRQIGWELAGLTGGGEVVSAGWRWWEHRPRATVGVALPWSGSVLELRGLWERQTYRASPDASHFESERRSVRVSLSDWTSWGTHWRAGGMIDRWATVGSYAGAGVAADQRLARDRLAVMASAAAWAGDEAFGRVSAAAAWRTSVEPAGWQLVASAGVTAASGEAPPDIWPGAGTGHARDQLLRAHPLLKEGVIVGEAFGRRLVNSSVELTRPVTRLGPLTLRAAAFVDAARAWRGFEAGRAHVDVGLGLRFGLPGDASALRVDFAHGLADGNMALSVGWTSGWPWKGGAPIE